MAEDKALFDFDNTSETVQVKTIREAGIYTGCDYKGFEYKEASVKDGKKVNAMALLKFTAYKIIKGTDNQVTEIIPLEHNEMLFSPATQESEIQYFGDKYENGKVIRKNNAQEQMAKDWEGFFIKLLQLGVALGHPFNTVKNKLAPAAKAKPADAFKKAIDTMINEFPIAKQSKFDVKMIWNNNDRAKTSFLRIGVANARKLAFAQHIPGQETKLFMDDYDLKSSKPKWLGQKNTPKSDNEIIGDTGEGLVNENLGIDNVAGNSGGNGGEEEQLF